MNQLRLAAAIRIQNRYRTYRCRKIIGEAAAQKAGIIMASVRIQATYRGMVSE